MVTIIIASVGITVSFISITYIMFTEVKKYYKKRFEERVMSLGICPSCGQPIIGLAVMDTRGTQLPEKRTRNKEREKEAMGFKK